MSHQSLASSTAYRSPVHTSFADAALASTSSASSSPSVSSSSQDRVVDRPPLLLHCNSFTSQSQSFQRLSPSVSPRLSDGFNHHNSDATASPSKMPWRQTVRSSVRGVSRRSSLSRQPTKTVSMAIVAVVTVFSLWRLPSLLRTGGNGGGDDIWVDDEYGQPTRVSQLDRGAHLSLRDLFAPAIARDLSPWDLGFTDSRIVAANSLSSDETLVRQSMLNSLELFYHGTTFRVRFLNGTLQYRQTFDWTHGYMWQRAHWTMTLLQEMADEGHFDDFSFDAVWSVGDGPSVAADFSSHLAGVPIFSRKTTSLHLDIAIPDPTVYPDYGRRRFPEKLNDQGSYAWPERDRISSAEWPRKDDRIVFRGSTSCYQLFSNNYLACTRIRSALLAQTAPRDYDFGISMVFNHEGDYWPAAKMPGSDMGAFSEALTREEVERVAVRRDGLTRRQQAGYKYILDLNGGTGSARSQGILSSGSILMTPPPTHPTWIMHFARPWVHYVPVDPQLGDLDHKLAWLRRHPREAHRIARQGESLALRVGTRQAAKQYIAQLLREYSRLLHDDTRQAELEIDPCTIGSMEYVKDSPTSCGRQWGTYEVVPRFLKAKYKGQKARGH